MKKEKLIDMQYRLNERLAITFYFHGVKRLKLTSLGNSIASGYSCVRTIKPLLYRNESIQEIMDINGIALERYHFARAQNNNDEHIYSWLTTNIKESEIYKMNKNDYGNSLTSMPGYGLVDCVEKLYSVQGKSDMGLQDVILENKAGLANIVIYNGCTGSFLDNVTRNGKLQEKLTYGFKRDFISLEATLKYIQISNRVKKTNTQVYLCGVPNYLGLGVSNLFINNKLKDIAKQYANVNYVEPLHAKLIYPDYAKVQELEQFSASDVVNLRPDLHLDEQEYLQFNNGIIKKINDSYLNSKAMIELDRALYQFSSSLEFDRQDLLGDEEVIMSFIDDTLSRLLRYFSGDAKKTHFLKQAREYLLERAPYDFHYAGKKCIKDSIQKQLNHR